jgi:hypothetical protein
MWKYISTLELTFIKKERKNPRADEHCHISSVG